MRGGPRQRTSPRRDAVPDDVEARPAAEPHRRVRAGLQAGHSGIKLNQASCRRPSSRPRTEARCPAPDQTEAPFPGPNAAPPGAGVAPACTVATDSALDFRAPLRKVALAGVMRGPVATAGDPPRDRRLREKRMGESATRGSRTRKPPAPSSNRLQTGRDVSVGGSGASGRSPACGQDCGRIVENRIRGRKRSNFRLTRNMNAHVIVLKTQLQNAQKLKSQKIPKAIALKPHPRH